MKRVIKYFFTTAMLMLLSGCTTVNFTAPDGTSVSYTRLFTDVSYIEGNVGGNKITVGGSSVNVESLTNLIKAMPR